MVSSVFSASPSFSIAFRTRASSVPLFPHRSSTKSVVSALGDPYNVASRTGLSRRNCRLPLKLEEQDRHARNLSYGTIEAKGANPPIMPAVITPGGPLDLSSVLFRNRIIFIGQPINSQVAQRVISQLVTLATIDENADILVYLNCPGGSTYSVLAIYDCMSWIKPKVGTICFGVAASQGALLLAGGEKGMRYAMPNARIMIHQPQSGCGGHVEDVKRQVNEAVQSRHKIDKMYAAFTGQPVEKVQQYTERDRFLSVSEAIEFGLIDGALETEY
ncbi:ATP-dependent Clp protease proteolytic subunit 6, chloroplastic [Malania oleifera]|uniref:ATP-dependent Clp protease proteolytic subunit 6, chloroplastic n=1 Tax=Malania oleifera TaxID=397392 RepID=UPI0025AE58DF|nr:ATP-dependent Clp protease proteolytic subunit 6, chloroplastic [Malania oleifera]